MNRPITTHEVKSVIEKLLTISRTGPIDFTGKFYQKRRTYTNPSQLFQKTEEGGTLPKTFYEANITLTPKLDKDTTKKENYRPVSLMNIYAKILNKILANKIQQYTKNYHTPQPCRIYPRFTRLVKHM